MDVATSGAAPPVVLMTGYAVRLEQAQRFVADTGKNRMWRYDWPPVVFRPERVIAGIRALGVDVSNWGA